MFAKSIGVPQRVFPQTNLGCQERSRNLHQRHEGQGKSERRLEVGKIMVAGWQWISTLFKQHFFTWHLIFAVLAPFLSAFFSLPTRRLARFGSAMNAPVSDGDTQKVEVYTLYL